MPRYEDLTGQKFGKLTVLEATDQKSKDGRRIWKCLCECGNIKFTTCQNLKRGHCTSCGCKNKEQITKLGHANAANLIGQRFGKLLVIKKAEEKLPYSDSIAWICQCDCGNTIITTTSSLKSGNTSSCGCSHKSEGEELIESLLINNHILFEKEKTINDLLSKYGNPLRFDFFLPQFNCFIEFDGDQHYKFNRYFSIDNYNRDCLKNKYCLEHNIKLYRIPYSQKKNMREWKSIEELLQERFIVKEIDHYHLGIDA